MPKLKVKEQVVVNKRIDKLVAQYIMIRNHLDELEKEHKEKLAPIKEVRERLVGKMLEFLDTTHQESAKTAEGTVYATVRHTAVCTDPDMFIDFVREHDLYELMDRRANAVACRDYASEHGGTLPPGVKINSLRTVGVRAS